MQKTSNHLHSIPALNWEYRCLQNPTLLCLTVKLLLKLMLICISTNQMPLKAARNKFDPQLAKQQLPIDHLLKTITSNDTLRSSVCCGLAILEMIDKDLCCPSQIYLLLSLEFPLEFAFEHLVP